MFHSCLPESYASRPGEVDCPLLKYHIQTYRIPACSPLPFSDVAACEKATLLLPLGSYYGQCQVTHKLLKRILSPWHMEVISSPSFHWRDRQMSQWCVLRSTLVWRHLLSEGTAGNDCVMAAGQSQTFHALLGGTLLK